MTVARPNLSQANPDIRALIRALQVRAPRIRDESSVSVPCSRRRRSCGAAHAAALRRSQAKIGDDK
eukprot:862097-Prymnesium_polylepis.2